MASNGFLQFKAKWRSEALRGERTCLSELNGFALRSNRVARLVNAGRTVWSGSARQGREGLRGFDARPKARYQDR